MKIAGFILLLLLLPSLVQAGEERCLDEESRLDDKAVCKKLAPEVDNTVYPNNISSRAQAVARAEAIRAKQAAERQQEEDKGQE